MYKKAAERHVSRESGAGFVAFRSRQKERFPPNAVNGLPWSQVLGFPLQ